MSEDLSNLRSSSNPKFCTGLLPSPAHKLLSSVPHRVLKAPPAQFAAIPSRVSVWGNNRYGICVTSQECFSKGAYSVQCGLPLTYITEEECIRWARAHGVLNGAMLTDVMRWMANDGIKDENGNLWKDGPYKGVDYSNEEVLKSAISIGPVNIGIASGGLPSSAGDYHGWYSTNTSTNRREDHCVALCGYGTAEYLYQELAKVYSGVTRPSALPADTNGYLLFTWGTIGFVTHGWLMGKCWEAWLREPTTPGQSPVPPTPPTPPEPPTPPSPVTLTIPVPQQPVMIGNFALGYVPAHNLTVNLPQSLSAGALPPWLLALLKVACSAAPGLPSPYKELAMVLCTMLQSQTGDDDVNPHPGFFATGGPVDCECEGRPEGQNN